MKALRPGELTALVLSFCYFLLLLAAYYVLRPVRDGLIAGLGTDEMKFLSLVVLAAMLALTPLYGFVMTRFKRFTSLPIIYLVAASHLLVFVYLFSQPQWADWSARAFYVWITVFNLFVVSVFWSVMADTWREEQGRRLFGTIASGGSLGGLLGPTLAESLAGRIGNSALVFVAFCLLLGAVTCLWALLHRNRRNFADAASAATTTLAPNTALRGSSWQGIALIFRSPLLLGVAALVAIGSIVGMFAYIETGRLTQLLIDTPEARTAFYARLDLWTNGLALILQAGVVGWVTSRLGVAAPLLGLAITGCLSFVALALAPMQATLAVTTVIRRAAEFGLGKPGRDMLYTVTSPQEKYLAKNMIDTVGYRASDAIGGWLHTGLVALGVTLVGIGWIAAALAGFGAIVALAVVRDYRRRGGR